MYIYFPLNVYIYIHITIYFVPLQYSRLFCLITYKTHTIDHFHSNNLLKNLPNVPEIGDFKEDIEDLLQRWHIVLIESIPYSNSRFLSKLLFIIPDSSKNGNPTFPFHHDF